MINIELLYKYDLHKVTLPIETEEFASVLGLEDEDDIIYSEIDIQHSECDELPSWTHEDHNFNFEELNEIAESLSRNDVDLQAIDAYIEEMGTDEINIAISEENKGNLILYSGMGMEDVARQYVEDCYTVEGNLLNYIDFIKLGEDMRVDGNYYPVSSGILEIAS